MVEAELFPEVCRCAWCESNSLKDMGPVQKNPIVSLYECNNCSAIGVSRMPTPAALNLYYGSYYATKDDQSQHTNVTVGSPIRMARLLAGIAQCAEFSSQSYRILDFGGGDGTLSIMTAAELLREKYIESAHIALVDYGNMTRAIPDPRIDVTRMNDITCNTECLFDLVIASAVLEHIPDAPFVLESLLEQMKPGGILYIRTPATGSFIALWKALGLIWDFTFPAHLYDLGQSFWEKYFGDDKRISGFDMILSGPSVIEASFIKSPIRASLSWLCKAPWYLIGSKWTFVGGWEIAVMKKKNV